MDDIVRVPRVVQRIEGCAPHCCGWDYHTLDCPVLDLSETEFDRRREPAARRVRAYIDVIRQRRGHGNGESA